MAPQVLKKISYALVVTSLVLVPVVGIVSPASADRAPVTDPNKPPSGSTGFTNPLGSRDVPTILRSLVTFLLGLIGILALAALVYGAIKIITAFGEGGKVSEGKKIIFWAIMGLAIALGATVIVEIVSSILLGS